MTDLGNFGHLGSSAYSINNKGQIAADYDTADGGIQGVLYDHGTITELGSFGGGKYTVAKGINSNGDIVGYSDVSPNQGHAFLWKNNGKMKDLGTFSGNSVAEVINDAGQIAGFSVVEEGNPHICLFEAGGLIDINGANTLGDVADIIIMVT